MLINRNNSFCRDVRRQAFVLAGALAVASFLLPLRLAVAGPMTPQEAMRAVTSTINVEQAAHKRGEKWEREQSRLMEEVRQARLEHAWYALQVETFEGYVATAEARVASLSKAQEQLQRMQAELEGKLVGVVEELDSLVANDVPFLPEERHTRLAFLRKTVEDYDLESAEKLRRVLEGLQAEMSYGDSVERTPGVIEVAGQKHNVTLIRAGRVVLYALAPGGAQGWRWARGEGYVPLDAVALENLRQADVMLETKRISSLFELPVLGGE